MAADAEAAEGSAAAALDPHVFLQEVRDRCLDRVVRVRDLRRGFKLLFYKSPNDPRAYKALDPLRPGSEFFLDQVVLSDDGLRVAGRINIEDDCGNRLWVNLRSRVNGQGLLRPTWYVDVPAAPAVAMERSESERSRSRSETRVMRGILE